MGAQEPRALRRGSQLGKYRLERRIGRGAVADVWKARDTVERRDVALKIAHPSAVEQFGKKAIEWEALVAARLVHPNVVRLYNADWIDGRFVLATELGRTSLDRYKGARRSGRVALAIVRQLARGLAAAHAQRIMHRDVKPENVVIFPDGRAALADFGEWRFAKGPTQIHTEAGTFGYIAPEQAYGRARLSSDVFSLGLIAYEVLTGELPGWPFTWPPEGHRAFRAKVPAPLQPILRRAIELDPGRRWSDAVEFSTALERAFARLEHDSRPRAPRRRRRRKEAPSPLLVEAALFRRAHGVRLGLRYHCHRCDGPIAESMAFCPWCGSKDNSFRDVTTYSLVCPDCERGVRPEWKACPWCFKGRLQSNGRRPPPDPLAERRCSTPGCEGQLRRYMRYCPLCKRRPRRPWTDPELGGRCPRCRWPTSHASWRFCPWCGRREPRAGSFVRGRAG
jgi:serine/threonine-protein kinase